MSNWTSEQQTAIYERNCNLLVSAAAGSGKTAVLVERIVSRVFDERNPVDIDRIVIVTFTKSAAGEMKERLTKRFEDILKADCGNRRAIRQIALINHAKITTIDSFCSYILKNYYKDRKRQNNSNTEQGGIEQNKVNINGIEQNELEYKRNNSNKVEQTGTISSNIVKNSSDIEQSVLDEVCAF